MFIFLNRCLRLFDRYLRLYWRELWALLSYLCCSILVSFQLHIAPTKLTSKVGLPLYSLRDETQGKKKNPHSIGCTTHCCLRSSLTSIVVTELRCRIRWMDQHFYLSFNSLHAWILEARQYEISIQRDFGRKCIENISMFWEQSFKMVKWNVNTTDMKEVRQIQI